MLISDYITPVMFTDSTGYSFETFLNNAKKWLNETFGLILYKEATLTTYFLIYEERIGVGYGKSTDRPIEFYLSVPDKFWKIDQYSLGVKFNGENGKGLKLFIGSVSGFGWYDSNGGNTISLSILGRIGFRRSQNLGDGYYSFEQTNINIPEVFIVFYLIVKGYQDANNSNNPPVPNPSYL